MSKENLGTPDDSPAKVILDPTLGEIVSKLQAEVLQRNRFVNGLGRKKLNYGDLTGIH